MQTTSKSIPVSAAQALLKTLKEAFPVFLNSEPLSIGIDKQIIAKLPDVDRKVLRMTLAYHTKSTRYLQKLAKAETRFDLEGNPTDALNDTHRAYAVTMLKERAQKNAARIKEQAAFERQKKAEAEEAENAKKRAEKLNRLAMKFAK
ncbi:ProQ/FINO family protein [Undibacterium sp. Dicai25W]|uniref:ProQ/FINO family protein n=1 Tax=Undibacterium sp. Dicai25W TaxID=3413034 RepID=UPI003BEFB588